MNNATLKEKLQNANTKEEAIKVIAHSMYLYASNYDIDLSKEEYKELVGHPRFKEIVSKTLESLVSIEGIDDEYYGLNPRGLNIKDMVDIVKGNENLCIAIAIDKAYPRITKEEFEVFKENHMLFSPETESKDIDMQTTPPTLMCGYLKYLMDSKINIHEFLRCSIKASSYDIELVATYLDFLTIDDCIDIFSEYISVDVSRVRELSKINKRASAIITNILKYLEYKEIGEKESYKIMPLIENIFAGALSCELEILLEQSNKEEEIDEYEIECFTGVYSFIRTCFVNVKDEYFPNLMKFCDDVYVNAMNLSFNLIPEINENDEEEVKNFFEKALKAMKINN